MLVVTTDNIPGYEVGLLGAVNGTVIEDVSVIEGFGLNLEKAAQDYKVAINKAVQLATAEAEKLGADAIVSLKLSYSSIRTEIVIITAYGTAAAIKYL